MKTIVHFTNKNLVSRTFKDHYPVMSTSKNFIIIRNNNTNINDAEFSIEYVERVEFEPEKK